jgi:YHS domain-containing protein
MNEGIEMDLDDGRITFQRESTREASSTLQKDPVCGMDVSPAEATGSREYRGTTYYFCSSGCKKDFDGDPARYVG